MKKILLAVLLIIRFSGNAQQCNCNSIFQEVKTIVENNYAGWFDKMKIIAAIEYKKITEKTATASKQINKDKLCFAVIKTWIDQFKDGHLRVNLVATENNGTPMPLTIREIKITEDEVKNYFNNPSTKKSSFEGIWENETYKVALLPVKNNSNEWNGIILTSGNDNWKAGEVKFIIRRKGAGYIITYISGDKSSSSQLPVKVVKNILDGTENFFYKVFPVPAVKLNFDEYIASTDPTIPSLSFPATDLALFKLPNFYSQNYSVLKELLQKNESKLSQTSYWIVDLRNNEGGNIAVGKLLLPYLYTNPIISYNSRFRVTKSNYQHWFDEYVKETYDGFSVAQKKTYDSISAIVLKKEGSYHHIRNRMTITDTILYNNKPVLPKKTAVLINGNTSSSGELFCLLAKQSSKVIFYGQPSNGTIDYGNIVTYETGCSNIRLTLPIDRYNWLDYGISIDRDKIKPDIYIPAANKNWLQFVQTDIKKLK